MKTAACLCAAFLLMSPASLAESGKNIDLSLGYRSYGSAIFEGSDDQFGMTVKFDFGGKWVRPAFGFGFSASDTVNRFQFFEVLNDPEAELAEWSAGVVVSRFDKPLRGYFGAGVAWISADVVLVTPTGVVSDDDSDNGIYLNTGFVRSVGSGQRANVGLDLRFMTNTKMTIGNVTADADYFQIGFLIGIRFGKRYAEPADASGQQPDEAP